MVDKINEFNKKYKEELLESLKFLSNSGEVTHNNNSIENFAFHLEEIFDVLETTEYSEYVKTLNKIELCNPRLVEKLEEYLIKEINLVALLGFHAGVISRQKDDSKL